MRDMTATIEHELAAGEQPLWTGRPAAVPWLLPTDWVLIPLGLLSLAVSVTWLSAVLATDATVPAWVPVFGVLLVLGALHLTAGRLLARRSLIHRTSYAVTTDRVIVATEVLKRRRVTSAYIDALAPPVLRRRRGATRATLLFGESWDAPPGWTPRGFALPVVGRRVEAAP